MSRHPRQPIRRLGLALTVSACLLLVAPARADERLVEPTPEVFALNEEGVRLAVLGQHDEAIATFEKSLALQQLNITWVNLGRARARKGDCTGAREAYAAALTAPRVADPAPQQIVAAVDGYLRDLEATCVPPADDDALAIGPAPGDDDPLAVLDPDLVVRGEGGGDGRVEPKGVEAGAPTVENATRTSFSPWSYALLGTGGALLASALVIDLAALGPAFDELDAARDRGDVRAFRDHESTIETLKTTNYVLLGLGGASLVAGVVLLALDLTDDSGAATTTGALPDLRITPDGASIAWRATW